MIVYGPYRRLSPDWNLWIIKMKLKSEGLEPESISANAEMVWLRYPPESIVLDEVLNLKDKVAKLMSDVNIGLYTADMTGYTVFEVDDLYDSWRKIEEVTGVKIKYIYANIPFHKKLEIWIKGTLTPQQKSKLKEAYSKLIREKP